MKPFIKWAGGKAKLADKIVSLFPGEMSKRVYWEPFLGGGAVFFHMMGRQELCPERSVLSDTLAPLVLTYQMVQRYPAVLKLELARLAERGLAGYYETRSAYNKLVPTIPSSIPHLGEMLSGEAAQIAAMLIYLNKTCFNGLYRTNKNGEFNTPIGDKSPRSYGADAIDAASIALEDETILCCPFDVIDDLPYKGDVVYMDPPYIPTNATSNFTGYAGGFSLDDQDRLADMFATMARRGVHVILSNSDTEATRKLYKGFTIHEVSAARAINSKGERRQKIGELIITP